MPIYEYQCKSCGTVNEIFELGSRKDQLICLKCKGTDLSKIMSVVAKPVSGSSSDSPCTSCSPEMMQSGGCGMGGGCDDMDY